MTFIVNKSFYNQFPGSILMQTKITDQNNGDLYQDEHIQDTKSVKKSEET